MDKVIAFELSADMAFFRRGYTTTSTLTYSFPPKTSVSGLLAAVLGKKEGEYRETFNRSSIAVVIASPLRKQFIVQNLLYIKGSENYNNSDKRLQVPFQYIMHPKYRIYFYVEGDFYGQLKQMFENGESIYTPYLGIANCLANITYLGEFSVMEREVSGNPVAIDSVIPLQTTAIGYIDFSPSEDGLRISRERVPVSMDDSRVVLKFCDVIYAERGPIDNPNHHTAGPCQLNVTTGRYWEVRGRSGLVENVLFF